MLSHPLFISLFRVCYFIVRYIFIVIIPQKYIHLYYVNSTRDMQGFQTPQGIGASKMHKSAAVAAACAVLGCKEPQLEEVLTQRAIATGRERVVKPLKVCARVSNCAYLV